MRIKGIFAGIETMVIESKSTRRLQLTDQFTGPSERIVESDRLVVIQADDMGTVRDRMDDFGISGMTWRTTFGKEYAYRSRGGDVIFKIGALRNQRRFADNLERSENTKTL